MGRFLSVDPLVGNPLSAQDYNGYSYCANNPLAFTDPSGYTKLSYREFVNLALNSEFGGHWESGGGGGGDGSLFTSDADAYQAGADYNNANNSWANTCYPSGASVVSSTSTTFSVSFNFGRFRITKGSWLSLWGRLKDAFFFESKTTGTSWLEPNSSVDLVNQNQTNTDMLPDWTKLSNTERARYILEAGAASDTWLVNINHVFKNFRPIAYNNLFGFVIEKPVNVVLGGRQYKVAMHIFLNTKNADGSFNPILDLSITNDQHFTSEYGSGTVFNTGHYMTWYLNIYGDDEQVRLFKKWYGW